MASIEVNGVNLIYEAIGDGPSVVWTPSAWAGIDGDPGACAMCGRLSAKNRALIYDRRNCGNADILIEDSPSEFYLWAKDLHAMLTTLNITPAYVGGSSLGQCLAILFAHLYPHDVNGLLLRAQPHDDAERRTRIAEIRYLGLAKVASKSGMNAVIDFAKHYAIEFPFAAYPLSSEGNVERLLSMDADRFASVMTKWGEWFSTDRIFVARLSDEKVKAVAKPALILPGCDDMHPLYMSERLNSLLPDSELVDYADWFTPDELTFFEEGSDFHKKAAISPIVYDFIQHVEAR